MAVLLGVLLPSLSHARTSAGSTECKSNLRGIGVMYSLYAADHAGQWPVYPFSPGPDGVVREMMLISPGWGTYPGFEDDRESSGHFSLPYTQVYLWAHPLQPYASDEPINAPYQTVRAVTCPAFRDRFADLLESGQVIVEGLAGGSYLHPFAFFTRPEAWTQAANTPVHVNAFHGAPIVSQVRLPGMKAVLVESESFHVGRVVPLWGAVRERFNILAADGHVTAQSARAARPGVATAGATLISGPLGSHDPKPFLSTIGGLRSADW